jgi:hypothetical protein
METRLRAYLTYLLFGTVAAFHLAVFEKVLEGKVQFNSESKTSNFLGEIKK